MDQGRNVDPYIMGTRMRICWFNKGNSSFLIPSNIIDGNHFVPIFSQRQARWIALSISRNLGSWLEPRERHVCGRRCRWFPWSFSVSLLHARRRASLSLRLSCSSPVPASPKTDAAPLSPSMRNRAPSTRIGAARDPGAVPAQSPLALPPSLLRPDGVPEVKRKEELDGGGEAQRQTALLKEGRAAIKSACGSSSAQIEGEKDLIGSAWRDWMIMRINTELSLPLFLMFLLPGCT